MSKLLLDAAFATIARKIEISDSINHDTPLSLFGKNRDLFPIVIKQTNKDNRNKALLPIKTPQRK